MLPHTDYVKAESVAGALELMNRPGADIRLLAGGTDLLVDLRERRRAPALLVDISEVGELAQIRVEDAALQIGAGVKVAALREHPAVQAEFPALAEAARWFADYLTRNKATIGGNLANASPGADFLVPLLALDASVVIASPSGDRTVPLDAFVLGPRQTALGRGELLRSVVLPRPAPAGQAYEKLGLKHGGAIAVVSSVVLMDVEGGRCARVQMALGAAAPRPFRATAAEALLEGQPLSAERAEQAAALAAGAAQPITDVRGSQEYRRAMVRALVRRGIDTAYAAALG